MVGPGVRPEDGIANYAKDPTQGPAAAMACAPATIFRNYFVGGKGQGGGGRQLDLLTDCGEVLGNSQGGYWRTENGYCLPHATDTMARLGTVLSDDPELAARARDVVRVGVQWDTEVCTHVGKGHRVCQVFASAVPVSYAKSTPSGDFQPFASLVLEGMYEATIGCAAALAAKRRERVSLFLTAVGGSAFGNRQGWIIDAIERALTVHREVPVDVKLVHFGTLPKGAFADLSKGRAPAGRKSSRSPARAAAPARKSSRSPAAAR
eukprot:TRINITY_DN11487_c0_g1_i1.p1 TRINITY_DN11487_c0_g1~~TRINITY_DN11487_c0_g1_i1.p1  ORF type:complete len:264 (+),score=55.98 TRINITY_DN11487_c0_g1_i1:447-1238(+)